MTLHHDHLFAGIQKAIDTIEGQLRNRIEIEELAANSGMSFWHFQHTFSDLLREPVSSYIRRRRLTEIARELKRSDRPMIETAFDFQFQSHASFTRSFRSMFGLTPVEFRRRPRTLRSFRPSVGPDHLRHVAGLPSEPELVDMPELRLTGLTASYRGITSENPNDNEVIPRLWNTFAARQSEVSAITPDWRFGAWDFATGHGPSDEYRACASLQISGNNPTPPDMEIWIAPAGRYARFTHKGPYRLIRETISFIYSAWLPRSTWKRGPGFDYMRLDQRLHDEDPQNEVGYYLPLQRGAA